LDVTEPPRADKGGTAKDREGAQVLLRYGNGRPALVARRVGAGEVLLVTTAADALWSDWPIRYGLWVPFLDAAVNHLLHAQAQVHNFTAGEPLRWQPPEKDATRPFVVVRPDGQ